MATPDDALVDDDVDRNNDVDLGDQGVDEDVRGVGGFADGAGEDAVPGPGYEPGDGYEAGYDAGEGYEAGVANDRTPRSGRPIGAIIAMVVAGVLLLFGTTALAKILNPKLASMPPVMRKPAAVAAPTPEAPVLPVVVASVRPSPSPSRSRRPPARSTPTSPATPPLLISAEAEAAERSSQPRERAVAGASGGRVLGNIGRRDEFVRFTRLSVPGAGRYTLTVFYITTSPRVMTLRINGDGRAPIMFGPTGSSETVGSRQLTVTLAAGENTLQLDNVNETFGPEIDRITITR